MKKKVLTLIIGFLFATSTFAIKGTIFPILSQNIAFDSVGATCKIDSIDFSGTYQIYYAAQKIGDNLWKDGAMISVSGINIIRSNSIHDLIYDTDYRLILIAKKGSFYDTLPGSITFRTKPKPLFPTITWIKQPAIGISKVIVTVNGANGYYIRILAFYGGNSPDSVSNTITGTGSFTSTLYFSTLLPNTNTNFFLQYEVDNNVPITNDPIFGWDSLRTPALANAQFALNAVSNLSSNSARTSISITKGSFNGTLKRILKDSLGTVVRTLPDTAVTTAIGVYPADYTGLSADKFYKYYFIYTDQLRTDTVWGTFRTGQRALVPAPVIVISPSITSNCGKLTLSQATFSGDTTKSRVVISYTGNFNDAVTASTLDPVIGNNKIVYNIDVNDLPANTRVYIKIIGTTSDSLVGESNVVSGLTPPIIIGPTMDIAIINNNTANPKLQVIANGNCDLATGFIEIKQNGFTVRSITVSIGSSSYDSLINLSTLPDGDYVVEAIAKTAMFPNGVLKAVVFHKGLATGIKENFSKKPDADIIIYDYTGVEIWFGKYSQLQYQTQLFGKYIIVYDVGSGRGFHTSIGYEK